MASKNDIFADLFTDFKSSTSSLNLNEKTNEESKKSTSSSRLPEVRNNPPSHKTVSTESLIPSNVNNNAQRANNDTKYNFDDIFASELPPKNNLVNKIDMFDDLLIPNFHSSLNLKEESPVVDDNPFETFKEDSKNVLRAEKSQNDNATLNNEEPNLLLDISDNLPHLSGFFSSSSNILEKGKTYIQSQFNSSIEGRLSEQRVENPQQASKRVFRDKVIEKEKSAPIVEDLLLLDINVKPKQKVNKSAPNLLENHTLAVSKQSSLPADLTISISNFEKDSYFDFKNQGTNAFKLGHYDLALDKFKMASDSIPKNHIYQVIILRNLISTTFKLGDLSAVKQYFDEVSNRLHLNDYTSWSSYKIQEKQPILLKDIMKKILISKGEYYEMKEDLQQAFSTYKEMLDLGLSDHTVVKKKQRLEKILNPKKTAPPRASLNKAKEKPKVPKVSKVIQEIDTTAMKARVIKKLEAWQGDKASDLRYLLLNLHTILPTWSKVDPKNLISPKKCKIYYFKAINQTHPDKIQQNTETENRILFETIFMALNKAWVSFKEDNDL